MVVPLYVWQRIDTTFRVDQKQPPITDYLNECTRHELIVGRLLEDNKVFRDLLSKRESANLLTRPTFLQEILKENINRANNKKICYSEHFKRSCTAMRIMMGPAAYRIFQANLGVPSLTTVGATLRKAFAQEEGELVVEEVVRHIKRNGEQMYAWIGEDDTKIQGAVRYDRRTDKVIGLEIPLDGNGVPHRSFFRFTTISAVKEYLRTYPVATYMKLVTLTTLSPKAHSYNVLIYGTKGTDKSENICARWKYIYNAFKAAGVTIVGFSSDGFPAFLKSMKIICSLPCANCQCPGGYKDFFRCKWGPDFLCIQDPTHICVKLMRAISSKQLALGKQVACLGQLISAIRHLPKSVTHLSVRELEGQTDMMSFRICERACAKELLDAMVRPEEQATKIYLNLIRLAITAFIDPKTTPADRIAAAMELDMFLRLWKYFLKAHSNIRRSRDTSECAHKLTLEANFVSSNVYECVLLNAHNLIMFHDYCRDLGRPDLFLPTRTGSQPNEAAFRCLRSMSTWNSTAVNIEMRDAIYKCNRLWFLGEHRATAAEDGTFNYKSARANQLHIPESLLSVDEVKEQVRRGFERAKSSFAILGCYWDSNKFPEPDIAQVVIEPESEHGADDDPENSLDFAPEHTPKKVKKPRKRGEKLRGAEPHRSEPAIPAEVMQDEMFLANLDYILANKCEELTVGSITDDGSANETLPDQCLTEHEAKKGYLQVTYAGRSLLIQKSSALWTLLDTKDPKVSVDRLRRFMGEKRVTLEGRIACGDFTIMNGGDKGGKDGEDLCQVLGFRYKKLKRRFFANSCPIAAPPGGGGIETLVARYLVVDGAIEWTREDPFYKDINSYLRHVSLKRDLSSGKMTLRSPNVP